MSIQLNIDDMESVSKQSQIHRFKITEGTHVLRVLPPFGTNHNNMASKEVNLHWGFTASNGQVRPVSCAYKHEGYCPICVRARELETLAARAKANGDEELEKQNLSDSQKLRNRKTFIYNVADKNGTVGVLELTKSTHDELIKLFKEYITKYDLDPTSLTEGVWFQISREGKGLKTRYTVKFNRVMAKVDGELIEKLDRSALAENIVTNYDKVAVDIHKLYQPVAASDLQRILDGAPVDEVVKRVKPTLQPAASEPAPRAEPKPAPRVEPKPEPRVEPTPAPRVEPKPAPKPVASEDDDWADSLND